MSSTIQVRVDDELKMKADELFKDLGTDTTTAIRMFLKQALAVNGFPFEIKKPNNNPHKVLREQAIEMLMLDLKRAEERAEAEGWIDANNLEKELGVI